MDSKSTDDAKRSAVHRSPSYPAITLQKAVERAAVFYQHERRNAANVAVAVDHWGYSHSSGPGRTTLAALLAFGLMRDEGASEKRQVRLTDLAFRIILDDRPFSSERDAALREAAMAPRIYRELLTQFPKLEVSDANLKHHLLVNLKFNDNAVKGFISDLRSTVSFAKLAESADNHNNEDRPVDEDEAEVKAGDLTVPAPRSPQQEVPAYQPQAPLQIGKPMPQKGVGMRQEVFALTEGDVTIQWPEKLSEESFQDFTDWLRILERKLKRSVIAQPPSDAGNTNEEDKEI